jgi:uroporphyrinogen decarboxylase
MEKPFLEVLKGKTLSTPPVWLMRQAGRYLPEYKALRKKSKNFLNFCYTPDLTVEATLQPLRRYHLDAAILFSDILVIPDAMGQKVAFKEGIGPILEPISSLSDLDKLSSNEVCANLEPVFETLSILSREIPEKTALIGFSGAPWTIAVYMVEGRGGTDCGKIKSWALSAPEDFQKLIDLLVAAISSYLIEQVKNGAEAIQLFDTWSGILDKDQFNKWVLAPTKKIVSTVKKSCPGIPILGFPKGCGDMYEDYVTETEVDGVSLDSSISLSWARDVLQKNCVLQGNLDNKLLVKGGAEMTHEVARILESLSKGPFIFNLGHGILPETPPEHVDALVKEIRNWGEK